MASNGIGVPIESAEQVVSREALEIEEELLDIAKEPESFKNDLSSFISRQFDINKQAKRNSGIEREISESLRAYNGEYSNKDKERIAKVEQGSELFMNITD